MPADLAWGGYSLPSISTLGSQVHHLSSGTPAKTDGTWLPQPFQACLAVGVCEQWVVFGVVAGRHEFVVGEMNAATAAMGWWRMDSAGFVHGSGLSNGSPWRHCSHSSLV